MTAVLSGVLAGCSAGEGGHADGIALVQKNQLTVCTHLPYKPFEFTDDSGQVVGFDVDLVGLLARQLGVSLNVVSMDWNQITSGAAFAAHKCDLAMGGATITPTRQQTLAFSNPYFNATQALLVRNDSNVSSLNALQGKRLGVQTDTTGALYAEKHADADRYTTVVFDDLALMTTAVSAGKVDAAIGDDGPMSYYAAHAKAVHVAASFKTGERYGFMAAKNDDNARKLLSRLNTVLEQSHESGRYDQRFAHWFGHAPAR